MKPAWSQTKLRHVGSMADCPDVGDELRFPSGRRYQVLGVAGRTLHCLVLAADAPVQGRVLARYWVRK